MRNKGNKQKLVWLFAVAIILLIASPLSAQAALIGDVSGDNSVTAYDAALTAQYAVSLISLTPDQITAADVSVQSGDTYSIHAQSGNLGTCPIWGHVLNSNSLVRYDKF